MFIENFDKIYGTGLYTPRRFYNIAKDDMVVAPYHHVLRVVPIAGVGNCFTVVLAVIDDAIKCGIYIDNTLNPIEVFELSKLDLKRIDTFKNLLSAKIQNHE